ncbi:MAG: cobalamin B12-binding domain-containing protein, partial [Candidatus Omnitrophica bacterium]|nr:cobalamin B12-binding domain-containing protein [Candidatus Omnitrophota bacterium]
MKNIPKVLLVQPSSRSKTPRPPLGLMYLSSFLTKNEIDNEIIDIKGKEDISVIQERILNKIKSISSDIIGITCLVTEIEVVEEMCRKIKEIKPDSFIVLGGAQPTTHPEHFIRAKDVIDYFVIGEGEATFTELVNAIREKRRPEDIQKINGLAWFDSDQVKRSHPRELVQDLNSLPFPAYDKVDMSYYTRPTSWGARPILLSLFWIFSSRGCPYRCKYCVAHEIFGKNVRHRSIKNVVDEIEFLVKNFNIDAVYFYDESFTVNKKRVIEICEEIKRRGLKIVFGCQTRVNLISEDIIKKNLSVENIEPDDLVLLKRVVENAKEYFKNPSRFKKTQQSV